MAYKLKSIRILLINDNMPLRNLLRALLLDLGFGQIETAADVESGWNLYCDTLPDIVIVDWRTDTDEQMDLIRRIRVDPVSPSPHIPIIVVTGHTNRDRVILARDTGVTEFLTKPFTVQGLTRYLMHIIEQPRDFVVAPRFTGPDRRRKTEPVAPKAKKRKKDSSAGKTYTPHTGAKSMFKNPVTRE